VPFDRVVPEEQRDPAVKATLRDPAVAGSAILAWAIQGARDWYERRLAVPEAVKLATTAYRVEMDAFGTFLRDCCVVGQTKEVPAADLHCAVDAYVRGAGERPLGAKALAKALRG